jgi:hypothetical protein
LYPVINELRFYVNYIIFSKETFLKIIKNIDDRTLQNLHYNQYTGKISYTSLPILNIVRKLYAGADQTFIIPTGLKYLQFEVIGGTGSGASSGNMGCSGGGQAGRYLKFILVVSSIPTITCHIGFWCYCPYIRRNRRRGRWGRFVYDGVIS